MKEAVRGNVAGKSPPPMNLSRVQIRREVSATEMIVTAIGTVIESAIGTAIGTVSGIVSENVSDKERMRPTMIPTENEMIGEAAIGPIPVTVAGIVAMMTAEIMTAIETTTGVGIIPPDVTLVRTMITMIARFSLKGFTNIFFHVVI